MIFRRLLALVLFLTALPMTSFAAIEDNLIPRPRLVEPRYGQFAMNVEPLEVLLTGQSQAVKRLVDQVKESLARAGLKVDDAHIRTEESESFALVMYRSKAEKPAVWQPGLDDMKAEGYVLEVTPSQVTASAVTEAGMFYSVMTLEQLIRAAEIKGQSQIPCVRILDWPAIRMRGLSEDYGRDQLPTMEDHKRTIRWLAQFKMNTFQFYIEPDHFVYKFDPDLGNRHDRFTFDEIRELVAYAKQYHIEIIPVVTLFGHLDNGLLSYEKYRGLAEMDDVSLWGINLSLADPKTYELMGNLVAEIAPAFESRYFHVALDETWWVGLGKSKGLVREKGKTQVYIDLTNYIYSLLKRYGKTMVMYADIPLAHPEFLKKVPSDIVVEFWDYFPRTTRFERYDELLKSGHPLMGLAAVWDWHTVFPIWSNAKNNIDMMAPQTAEIGDWGQFVSCWSDAFRCSGFNLRESNTAIGTYAAAQVWNPKSLTDTKQFLQAFTMHFYGTTDGKLVDAMMQLFNSNDPFGFRNPVAIIFSNPLEDAFAMATVSPDLMAWWKNLSQNSRKILELLSQVKPTRNADYYQGLVLCVRLLQWSADMATTYHELSLKVDDPNFDKKTMADRIDTLLKQRAILYDEYSRVFLATNRPKQMEYISKSWQWTTVRLESLVAKLREGAFPIQYDKKVMLSLDFDGTDKIKWRFVPEHAEPTLKDGGPKGAGKYLSVPFGAQYVADVSETDLDFQDRPFLIEAWVRYQGQPQQGSIQGIIQYGTGHDGYALNLMNDGIIRLTADESAFSNQYNLDCQKQHLPNDGQWHHIAVNFHRNYLADFYLDGKYIDTLKQKVTPKTPYKSQILIGCTFGEPKAPLGLDIDGIRIRQGVFTYQEVEQLK